MATKAAPQNTVSEKLIGRWEQVNQKLAALAEEIPESKFEHRLAEGVRTVGDVLRHVAFWNQYVIDVAQGKKADDTTNELSKKEFSTKAKVVGAVESTAAEVAKVLRQNPDGLSPETAELLVSFIEHNCEHYGQLVVYARLNGIVPPASRG